MSSYEKAQYIAEEIRRITGFGRKFNAEKIIEKCENQAEIDWWYRKIKGEKNEDSESV